MANRTTQRFSRFYLDGYDLSGDITSYGPLSWLYAESSEACLSWGVKGTLPGMATITIGNVNGLFNSDAAAIHTVANAPAERTIMAPIGMAAAPAAGDPCWCGKFVQLDYQAAPGDNMLTVTLPFSSQAPASLTYDRPWGYLLHAKGAETAANTGTGIDDKGAATTAGGYMAYQLFSSNGTVTLKVQDAATNSNASFADIAGATSGAIDATTTPVANIVELGHTATVRRYLRWQIELGTATTCTFALAFVRA